MPNRSYALEWLEMARRNLETAQLLFDVNHYTDVIAVDIQQTIEKTFKALYAFYGVNIPRTHVLETLYPFVISKLELEEVSLEKIITISDYYQTDRYPGPRYFLPSRLEVNDALVLATYIYGIVSNHISSS